MGRTDRSTRRVVACGALLALVVGVDASAQTLRVVPDSDSTILFSGFEGGPFSAETAAAWTLDDADNEGLDFRVESDQAWLSVEPQSGDVGRTFGATVTVNASINQLEAGRLAPGVWFAIVSFDHVDDVPSGADDTTRTVELRVAPASFSVSPPFVNAVATANGPAPSPVTVTLESNGQMALNYSLIMPTITRPWFSLSKSGGTVPGGESDSFEVRFNPSAVESGTYTAVVEVRNTTNGAGTTTIGVTLTVTPAAVGVVTLSPDQDIQARGPEGFIALPPAQTSTLANGSDREVSWQAVVVTEDGYWVSVTPQSGTLAARGSMDVQIRVNDAVNDLAAGSHVATVSFQETSVNLQNEVTVTPIGTRVARAVADPVLTVSSGPSAATLSVLPAGSAVAGGGPRMVSFPLGQVVTLAVTPSDGYQFLGWASDEEFEDPRANPLVITMNRSRYVVATVQPILRTLTLSMSGSGTGTLRATPTGAVSQNVLVSKYANGTAVTLAAEEDAGSVFAGWGGNVPVGRDDDNPLVVTMDRDRVITARFEPAVTLDVAVVGHGHVTIEPEMDVYPAGTVVTLRALADVNFEFVSWSGDAAGTGEVLSLVLASDTNITASFAAQSDNDNDNTEPDTATLVVDVVGDGIVSPNGGEFEPGSSVTLVATPGIGSIFVRWEWDASGTDLTTTVVMTGEKNVRAVFADDPSVGRDNPGTGSPCGAAGMLGFPSLFLGWATLAGVTRRRSRAGHRR